MAHFAQLDQSNIVTRVVVIDNADIGDSEAAGIALCQQLYGADTRWKQTSYNANFRKNYASIGYAYDEKLNAFIAPQPFKSWSLDTKTCQWVAPKAMPVDGRAYTWNEGLRRWVAAS